MAWESYNLDREAHDLVLKYRDKQDTLNQTYKMRVTVTYGLERFWGEQLRLEGSVEGNYWKDTWKIFADIMVRAGIEIPHKDISSKDVTAIQQTTTALWNMPSDYRKISLAILTQLCDKLLWWTQRYK